MRKGMDEPFRFRRDNEDDELYLEDELDEDEPGL